MRAALALLLFLHGAIHVLGFLKWSGLVPVRQLGDRTLVSLSVVGGRLFGLAWLLVTLAFLGATILWLAQHDGWWGLALGGVLLSQCLIVIAWQDAKAGTAGNLLILVPVVVAAAQARFSHRIDDEVRLLLAQATGSARVVEAAELEPLPAPVRRWLETAGIVGRPRARIVRLEQRGELRTSPDGAWMPARAQQHFSVEPPAFVWQVDATMMRVLPIAGRDKYVAGHGSMLIKAAALLNVVDVADEKIDHGAKLRFLGEIVWFPSAALSTSIAWEPLDASSARATMRDQGVSASAVFEIYSGGRVVGMRADRYLGGGADAKLTPWRVSCSEWRTFDGIEVPSRGEVGWVLESGYFSYYRWEILNVVPDRNISTAPPAGPTL